MITIKKREVTHESVKKIILALRLLAVVVLYLPIDTYKPLNTSKLRNLKLAHSATHAHHLSAYLINVLAIYGRRYPVQSISIHHSTNRPDFGESAYGNKRISGVEEQ